MPSMQDMPGLTEALRQYSSISSSVGELINRPSVLTESMEILQNAIDLPYTAIADTLLSALEPAGGIVKYFQEESAAEVSSLSKALENLIPSMPKMPDIMAAMNEFSAHIASVTHVNFDFSGICETAENLEQILEKHNISVLSSIITADGDSLEYLETMQEQLSEIPETSYESIFSNSNFTKEDLLNDVEHIREDVQKLWRIYCA